MKMSYECELATHIGPESCGAARKGGVEALTGERAGRVFSRVRNSLRDAQGHIPTRRHPGMWQRHSSTLRHYSGPG